MRRTIFVLLAGATLGGLVAAPAQAQSGLALKGHYIINSSAAEEAQETRQLPDADAFGLGAEFVLPFGLFGFIFSSNPGYITPMFGSGLGQAMLGAAGVMLACGGLWLKKLVNPEF